MYSNLFTINLKNISFTVADIPVLDIMKPITNMGAKDTIDVQLL